MTDKFRFAATYPVYGHMKVSFDGDLVELVSDCLWAEELGEQGSTSYWEWTGAEWSPIDVSEHVRQWGADRDAEFAEMDGGLALRPWKHAADFIGIQETRFLLTQMEARFPDLVKEAQRVLPVQKIAEILQRLVSEDVSVRNLRVSFDGFQAVDGVDLDVAPGELLGIVGESGSGKSVTMMALMGLVDAPGLVQAESLRFDGQDLLGLSPAQRRRIVGKDIAMVFQDALNSLNPSHTVGDQVREVLRVHLGLRGAALEARVLELFELVEIPAAKARLANYPHQMSGGMNQRVMIAMAIACQPRLLIADEPTTALDVTIQAQILDLLRALQADLGMSILLITHDLGVVAETCDEVVVMYHGKVMEAGTLEDVFRDPRHPYLKALMRAVPRFNLAPGERLTPLREVRTTALTSRPPASALSSDRTVLTVENVSKTFTLRAGLFNVGAEGQAVMGAGSGDPRPALQTCGRR